MSFECCEKFLNFILNLLFYWLSQFLSPLLAKMGLGHFVATFMTKPDIREETNYVGDSLHERKSWSPVFYKNTGQ